MEISNNNAMFLENTDTVAEDTAEKMEVYTIINPAVARPLIRMRAKDGKSMKHNLIDISPNKDNRNSSVWVFEDSLALRKDLLAITKAHKRAKAEQEKKQEKED